MWQRRLEDELEPWLVLNDSQPPELFCFLSFSLYLNFKTFLNPVFLLRVREKKKKNGSKPGFIERVLKPGPPFLKDDRLWTNVVN